MDDPFPSSLPGYESPRIYDPTLQENMNDGDFGIFDPHDLFNPPGTRPGGDRANETSLSSAAPKPNERIEKAQALLNNPQQWSTSPDSSSSSESSNQHKRASSSESSAIGDGHLKYSTTTHGIMIGADTMDDEASNKLMESHFDFDSAASSPIPPNQESRVAMRISNTVRMPYCPVGPREPLNPFSPALVGSYGSADSTMPQAMMKHEARDNSSGRDARPHVLSPNDFLLNNSSSANDFGFATQPPNLTAPAFPQHGLPTAFASPSKNIPPAYPPLTPTLHVAPLPLKSRVETQSNVKLTLDPLPPQVTRLHLQPYTISKSKLMLRPTPQRSPEMFELFTTLVCTSAMQDRDKYERAMARAAGTYSVPEKDDGRRSSAGDAESAEDDENKPLNGGPVKICPGCVERERKRAARKKTKNAEEEEIWLKDEAKRIVVFNTHEVKDWQPPSNSKTTDGNNRNMPTHVEEQAFSANAMQVDIPMRIACYCRHQEEKMGFRVIFTIRDSKNLLIAQTMSNSIIITDDHKTHPTPTILANPSMVYPEHTQLAGSNSFSQVPKASGGMAPFTRNAFSATDLQGMQQQLTNAQLNHPVRPFAIPQESSQATSTTMTPRNLSRPASPSLPSGPQSKRRKASGSSRIRSDLMMTKMPGSSNTSPTPASVNASSMNKGPNAVGNGLSVVSPTFVSHPPALSTETSFMSTNPPTPNNTDGSFMSNLANIQKSHSLENLQHFQDVLSAPTSVPQSRAHSPSNDPRAGVFHQPSSSAQSGNGNPQHAQMLANSLQAANRSPTVRRSSPVIHELTPGEGPKAGGFKVTCLGSGFSQGLDVMFGDAVATTTTYWGETTLVCLVPPALCAGVVQVTLKNVQGQQLSSPPNKPAYFKYVDDEQSELMRQMFAILGRDTTFPSNMDPGDFTRYVLAYHPGSSSQNAPPQGPANHRQVSSFTASLTPEVLEMSLLKCLEWIDLDDSPRKANLNYRGRSGQSMLHLCASLGFYRAIAGLLARGAHPDLRDNNGMSPMHMAALHDNIRIIRKLRAVGGDPTLRSLNGFTPLDMATSMEAQDATCAVEHHIRSRSRAATPVSNLSRTGSVLSRASSAGELIQAPMTSTEDFDQYDVCHIRPTGLNTYSRRNSLNPAERETGPLNRETLSPDVSQLATQSALTAWRDQLSAQIQQFQQTVHRALPPLPNLPDYQGYPVVRRISSLVPQRTIQALTERPEPSLAKEADYHWWELLTGASSSPPAYEDIYPDKSKVQMHDKKAAVAEAAGDAFMDRKCEEMFDQAGSSAVMETVNIGKRELTQQEQTRLRAAHAQKMKRLQSDRNLFFFWIPLLILVIVAMLRDRAPQLTYAVQESYSYIQTWIPGRELPMA